MLPSDGASALRGGKIDVDEYGEPIFGDHILMLFNADHAKTIPFEFPPLESGAAWERLFDTALPGKRAGEVTASEYNLQPCSVAVFRSPVDQTDTETRPPESVDVPLPAPH